MLICYHIQARLPQNDLIYLAFPFAVHKTISEIELFSDFDDGAEDMSAGFLIEVPFLHPVPSCVQRRVCGASSE